VIYLDANVIIRLLESDAASRASLRSRLQGRGGYLTSELSRLECRCQPMRTQNAGLLALYDSLFAAPDMRICAVDRQVIDKATEIRATTKLRAPDSLHLATAIIHGTTHFCTGDLHFSSIALMPIEII
jgi:predicted nucleic acid-binding protein